MRYCLLLVLLGLLACDRPIDEPLPGGGGGQQAPGLASIMGDINGSPYVVVGDERQNFYTAFLPRIDGRPVDLAAAASTVSATLLEDPTGTKYDVFGIGRGGGNAGAVLEALPAGACFWLTASGMFPGLSLNDGPLIDLDTLDLEYSPTYNIPINSLYAGAPFGVIRPMDEPEFFDYNRRREIPPGSYIEDDDWLIGISINGDTRLYPNTILTIHEIVNDVVGGVPVMITYSPLSSSARVWRRPDASPFGVSGLLWNSNMLMFDREETDDLYNQITGRCVAGPNRGRQLQAQNYFRTSWRHWQELVDRALILLPLPNTSPATARRMDLRIHNDAPHGFPIDYFDPRLPEKQRVFMITDGQEGKVYTFDRF